MKAATNRFLAVKAIQAEGIEFLKNFEGTIDLLYLDFWTDDKPGELPGSGRARAYLEAYRAARDKFRAEALILIDDTDHIDPWKQTYIVTWAPCLSSISIVTR